MTAVTRLKGDGGGEAASISPVLSLDGHFERSEKSQGIFLRTLFLYNVIRFSSNNWNKKVSKA
jgi:hypothetical protein